MPVFTFRLYICQMWIQWFLKKILSDVTEIVCIYATNDISLLLVKVKVVFI